MHRGFIKLYRASIDNPLYFSEKFNKWHAWLDLLMLANHKVRMVSVRGVMIEVKRGQVLASERFLADRWKWSRDKVRAFITLLQDQQQILPQKTNITTLLTVVNYEKYQEKPTTKPTTDPTTNPTNLKNVKNFKEEHRGNILRINALFNRKENTEWSDGEISKLKKLIKRGQFISELEEIERLYGSGYKYKRKDLITLLNNWTGELDKARGNTKAKTPSNWSDSII